MGILCTELFLKPRNNLILENEPKMCEPKWFWEGILVQSEWIKIIIYILIKRK